MKELRDFIGGIKRKRSFTSADISRFISEAGSVSEEYCTEYPDDPVECLVIAAAVAGVACHNAVTAEKTTFDIVIAQDGTRFCDGKNVCYYMFDGPAAVIKLLKGIKELYKLTVQSEAADINRKCMKNIMNPDYYFADKYHPSEIYKKANICWNRIFEGKIKKKCSCQDEWPFIAAIAAANLIIKFSCNNSEAEKLYIIAADTAAYVSKMSDFSVREDYRTNKSEYTALSPDGKVKYHYLHGKLISADFTENTEKLRIPDNIKSIEKDCFKDCTFIREVDFGNNLEEIGENAFSGCKGLIRVTFPDGLKKIGKEAFMECSSIKEITVPESVTEIEYRAFESCTGLGRIVIPVNVRLGNQCFDYNHSEVFIACQENVMPLGVFSYFADKTEKITYALTGINGFLYSLDYNYELTELRLSYYSFTGDMRAERYIIKNLDRISGDMFMAAKFNTVLTMLLKRNLISESTADRMTDKCIQMCAETTTNKSVWEERLETLLKHRGQSTGSWLIKTSEKELTESIMHLGAVPWNRIHFRVVIKDGECNYNYCTEELDTGYVSCRRNEKLRYGWLLIYRRRTGLYRELEAACRNIYNIYSKYAGENALWTSAEFTVEKDGEYSVIYDINEPEADDEWEKKYISESEPSEVYSADRLKESEISISPSDMASRIWASDRNAYIKYIMDYIRKCKASDADCNIEIRHCVTSGEIEKYTERFRKYGVEPDSDYIEWLKYCDGLTVDDICIHGIGRGHVYLERGVSEGYDQIAEDILFGYGLNLKTGECCRFDHDTVTETGFICLLDKCFEKCTEAEEALKEEEEKKQLVKSGYLLSDSHAEYLYSAYGEEELEVRARKAENEFFRYEKTFVSGAYAEKYTVNALN